MSDVPDPIAIDAGGAAGGLDYVALVNQGTALVQRMTGRRWTNFNWSDPGVTILQQLCYALTELSYRADFPVADLLADPATGRIALREQALYPARTILPVNPVTVDDLRRLLIDRVRDLGNAWVTPLRPDETGGVAGLYRIAVLVPDFDPGCEHEGPDPEAVRHRVIDCYTAHRALCEDVAEVIVLRPERARLSATVQLDDRVDPDSVLAELLFALAMAMAPEPKRTSLDALRGTGATTSEIFDGPLMLRGFITGDALGPMPCAMPVDALLEAMARVPGVLAVDDLAICVAGTLYRSGETIPVAEDRILALDTRAETQNGTIDLRHGASRCPIDPVRVRRGLARLWADQRRIYPLRPEYQRAYPVPHGQRIDPTEYESVQEQFPPVYGIGSYGLGATAGAVRQAQAHQLKGYLMVFDQLMADFFAQLGFMRTLMSRSAGGDRTYVGQSLRGIVPGVEALIGPDYGDGVAALVTSQDPVVERQLAILGYLLSLYGERLDAPADAECGREPSAPGAALVNACKALLARMVPATRDRGRGFDYRRRGGDSPATGLDVRCRIELALLDATLPGGEGTTVVENPADASFGRPLPPELSAVVAQQFIPVDDERDGRRFRRHPGPSPLAGQRVAAALMPALADRSRYCLGALPGSRGPVYLVCRDLDERCWVIGELRDAAEAVALTERLVRATGGEGARLVIVEWTLLRFARDYRRHHRRREETSEPGEARTDLSHPDHGHRHGHGHGHHHHHHHPEPPQNFSFRVSAVMAVERRADAGWRAQADRVVRENMPAHLVVEPLYLRPRRMQHFRRLHRLWVDALRSGGPNRRAKTSWHLARFLNRSAVEEPPRKRESLALTESTVDQRPDERFDEDDGAWEAE